MRMILKQVIDEILIIIIFLVLIFSTVSKVTTTVKSDGKGYYDYLPSLFIYNDLVRKDISAS
jgi:hypothetical protein